MKILQVIPYFVPAWSRGGPVAVAYNISRELVKRGHEVTVFTTDILNQHDRVVEKTDVIDGIIVKRFSNLSNSLAYNNNIFQSFGISVALSQSLKKYDIVHLHGYRSTLDILVHHYAKKYSIPYVIQAHGSLPRIVSKIWLKKIYDNLWGQNILRDTTGVIALSDIEVLQYIDRGVKENKIKTIPNGINIQEFENLPQRGVFKSKYNLFNDQNIILYLGRINKTKGIDLLVRAFSNLVRDNDNLILCIVGPDDGFLTELKSIVGSLGIGDKVLFTGPLYGKEKIEAYVDSDLYMLPSQCNEIFGITVLEACACGVPVIVTDRVGVADVVKKNDAGIVVSYDENALCNAILSILNDDSYRKRISENGKYIVREKYIWNKIVIEFEKIYEDCIHNI